MGSDTLAAAAAAYSINTSQKPSNYDEIFMRNSLQFADCLKDLKNLGKQLYSAAEHFEASYNQEDHQQFVVESSKDYVAQALVSTVDHLGSIADKLNKFLDEKAKEFSATKIRFSCIEQRINTFQGFIDLRGISRQSLEIEAPKNHKRYILPETSHIDKSKFMYKNCISCPESDTYMHEKIILEILLMNLLQILLTSRSQGSYLAKKQENGRYHRFVSLSSDQDRLLIDQFL